MVGLSFVGLVGMDRMVDLVGWPGWFAWLAWLVCLVCLVSLVGLLVGALVAWPILRVWRVLPSVDVVRLPRVRTRYAARAWNVF